MDDAPLAAIKARANAATAGPWRRPQDRTRVEDQNGSPVAYCDLPPLPESMANALFIAHARTDIPALVAEVRRLRALLAEHGILST